MPIVYNHNYDAIIAVRNVETDEEEKSIYNFKAGKKILGAVM